MEAVATYFRVLREGRSYTRAKLAAELGVSEMTIWRLEEEGQEPKAAFLTGLIRTLQARWQDIEHLFRADATPEDGHRLAQEWLQVPPEEQVQYERIRHNLDLVRDHVGNDPVRLQELIEQLRQMTRYDPAVIDLIEGILIGRRSSRKE